MSAITEAKNSIAFRLERDADYHESERFDQIGQSPETTFDCCKQVASEESLIAWNFWEAWIDEVHHDFAGDYGIAKNQWPLLAREIASSIRANTPINHQLLQRFGSQQMTQAFSESRKALRKLLFGVIIIAVLLSFGIYSCYRVS